MPTRTMTAVFACSVLAGGVAAATLSADTAPVAVSSSFEQRPRVSPRVELSADVDGVTIAMEYGSPSKRGRPIWGSLVPWTKWWMPGADETTSITTSGPLMVETLLVPAGTHTIYTQPGPDEFLLVINRQTGQFHTVYRPEMDLGRVPMTLTPLSTPVEQMTFAVTPAPDGGGQLTLSWDDRAYSVRLRAATPAP